MKPKSTAFCLIAAASLVSGPIAIAQLNIPSDGSDGALVVTNNLVIDLSQAVTTNWDANNSANAGQGIYDASKWAVVFKYSSVTINGGFGVSFINHPSHAPVVWLVSGDVIVDGTVSLDGEYALNAPGLAEPGPGGYRGGSGNYAAGAGEAPGFGPGGGQIDQYNYGGGQIYGAAGSYGSLGGAGSETYGNPSLIPLVGGSGGAGNYAISSGGGGGAGAILIASSSTLSISGGIYANGGGGPDGGGSGGGIRLVANTLDGNGIIQCLGGGGNPGGLGRIRIERVTNANNLQVTPGPSVVQLASGDTPPIWLPTNGPSVSVVSIGGKSAPVDPRSAFATIGADVSLPQSSSTTVLLVTTNIEQAATVLVRVTPRSNGAYSETAAGIDTVISQDPLVIQWKANVPVQNGYASVIARVIRP